MSVILIIIGAIIGSVIWYKVFYKRVYANAIIINPAMVYLRSWFVCVVLTCVVIGIIPNLFSRKAFEHKAEKSAKKIQGSWKAGELEYGIRAFDEEGELYSISYGANEYQVYIYDATNNQLLVGFVNPEEKTFRIEHRNENHEEYSYKTGWRKIKLKNDEDKITLKRKNKKWDYYGKKVTRLYESEKALGDILEKDSYTLLDWTNLDEYVFEKIMVEATIIENQGWRNIIVGDKNSDAYSFSFMETEIFDASYEQPSGIENFTGENHVVIECIVEEVEAQYYLLLVSVVPYDEMLLQQHVVDGKGQKNIDVEEEYKKGEDNESSRYEGWYENPTETLKMYVDKYDVPDSDGSHGRICVYDIDTEELVVDAPYYPEETGSTRWNDWGAERLYYFYDKGTIYYLGFDYDEIYYFSEDEHLDSYYRCDEEYGGENDEEYEEENDEEYEEENDEEYENDINIFVNGFNEYSEPPGYEGEYVNYDGVSMMYIDEFDAPNSEGAIGNICIYEGETLLVDTPYYLEVSGNTAWDDWDYDELYYFYDGETIYYLGVSSQAEGIVINYNSEDRNIDCYSVCTE